MRMRRAARASPRACGNRLRAAAQPIRSRTENPHGRSSRRQGRWFLALVVLVGTAIGAFGYPVLPLLAPALLPAPTPKRFSDTDQYETQYSELAGYVETDDRPHYAHFARVLGLDTDKEEIYIENTLRGGSYWTIPVDYFLAVWNRPETSASIILDSKNAENVTRWAVVIDGALVPTGEIK